MLALSLVVAQVALSSASCADQSTGSSWIESTLVEPGQKFGGLWNEEKWSAARYWSFVNASFTQELQNSKGDCITGRVALQVNCGDKEIIRYPPLKIGHYRDIADKAAYFERNIVQHDYFECFTHPVTALLINLNNMDDVAEGQRCNQRYHDLKIFMGCVDKKEELKPVLV